MPLTVNIYTKKKKPADPLSTDVSYFLTSEILSFDIWKNAILLKVATCFGFGACIKYSQLKWTLEIVINKETQK